ncbi:GFA family protein [Altericroceibacterium spongiae]|uniref:GFA family protein n=1 Tax=Altericroceibacterium spongiae TaxID=2320269 RepID=A0A420EC27_9SPHN|nr:GFA family protein [Altericroceibacterium spongiae]RKF18238.1 GFA family protein [Altericroceibacterium spongiae]
MSDTPADTPLSSATAPDAPVSGRCLCGAVEIVLEKPDPAINVCHCAMCLRWGGGPFAAVRAANHSIAGEDAVHIYRSSDWAERASCRECGSSLWYHYLPDGHLSFAAGLFTPPAYMAISEQIFVDEKPHWYDFTQQTPMKTGAEIIAETKAAEG